MRLARPAINLANIEEDRPTRKKAREVSQTARKVEPVLKRYTLPYVLEPRFCAEIPSLESRRRLCKF